MDTIHQELHDFLHSPRRLLVAMGILLFGSAILAQWLYPTDRTLPFTIIDGKQVGGLSQEELEADLQARFSGPAEFKTGSKVITTAKLADAGITPQYELTVYRALDYPWWERSIPFSLFTRQWSTGNIAMQYSYDTSRIKEFVKTNVMSRCNAEAVSATINVKHEKLTLDEGVEGRKCDARQIEMSLHTLRPQSNRMMPIPYVTLHPKRVAAEIKPLFEQLKAQFADGIAIEVDGTVHKVSARDVVSWFIFREDGKTHQLKVALNDAKVTAYLTHLRKKFYKEPSVRVVYLLDGAEQREKEGTDGRTINIPPTLATLKRTILGMGNIVQASMQAVVPQTQYVNDYSLTSRGLGALLQTIAREKGSYGLSVIEIDGRKRVANADGNRSFTTASTYKIFVAYSVLKEIEAGHIKWGQEIRPGMDTEACWDEMLVYSLNPCSWSFADMVGGWARIEQQAHAQGMTSTFLNASDKRSTANDEALYFARLERGQLLQGASRQRLIDTLLHQHYKSGIPVGTSTSVANKIGFYEGYLHDIGIVYAPKGRYVLAVMTYGGTWGGIADVARRVNEYMQR
jgi:beta-lactamase class A